MNHTPLPALAFPTTGKKGVAFGVMAARATFTIDRAQKRLRPADAQVPLVMADTPYEDEAPTSLKYENDLAPIKPATDVLFDAVAKSPEGRPAKRWPVAIQVGSLKHQLTVLGPNVWQRGAMGGWSQRAPLECTKVPLRYEQAFGGTYEIPPKRRGDAPTTCVYTPNPIGKGFVDQDNPPDVRAIEGAQIEDPRYPIEDPRNAYLPQALSPMHRSWMWRLGKAGTFDERWVEEIAPYFPADHDYRFHNAAHPRLTVPGYLQGGEQVGLVGLSHDKAPIVFTLPRYRVFSLVRYASGAPMVCPAVLDTVHICVADDDVETHRVYLTWRSTFAHSEETPVRKVEARMETQQIDTPNADQVNTRSSNHPWRHSRG